ncbi:hypothetical protein NMG60_11025570 [Bertholletia excelsa]
MVRAPCCEKMGLKKGPWAPEEDQILISFIQQHGHGNWRALPKQAGLLRCGKSCRLRWTNYLRPDIKRGNFSKEEEDTIIKLHEMLGNRWSAIAARLPGRTDNEIKNVWHTHLKKRLKDDQPPSRDARRHLVPKTKCEPSSAIEPKPTSDFNFPREPPVSPQNSSSELSSVKDEQTEMDSLEIFPQIDESFWSDKNSNEQSDLLGVNSESELQTTPTSPTVSTSVGTADCGEEFGFAVDNSMDFWYNLLIGAGGLSELPEF